jgi:hypothetical protein
MIKTFIGLIRGRNAEAIERVADAIMPWEVGGQPVAVVLVDRCAT